MSEEPDQTTEADAPLPPPGVVLEIKKYPNRRLYDTTRSRHLTLDELFELVAAGHSVRVRDSKTGEDLTNQILLQALIERDPLKISAVPTALIQLMIRMNAHLIASCFDLGLSQMFEAYRAAAGEGAPPPAGPVMAGAPWWPAGWPAVPGVQWPGSWGGMPSPGTSPPRPAAPEPETAEATESADLDRLRRQVAALAAELERLKSSRGESP
ncbi:MAG: polyhydroxyalkanoate synthesis regulator DNA-binding domain-containing protein [Planctomycetota bacterium]|jgi:polyhydroxyalkanoate synthesis repressor PhaR